MAVRGAIKRVTRPVSAAVVADPDSDYGSDLDDDTWDTVFAQIESQPLHEVELTSLEDTPTPALGPGDDASEHHQTCALHVARAREHLRAGFVELEQLLAHIDAGAGDRKPGPSAVQGYGRGVTGQGAFAIEGVIESSLRLCWRKD